MVVGTPPTPYDDRVMQVMERMCAAPDFQPQFLSCAVAGASLLGCFSHPQLSLSRARTDAERHSSSVAMVQVLETFLSARVAAQGFTKLYDFALFRCHSFPSSQCCLMSRARQVCGRQHSCGEVWGSGNNYKPGFHDPRRGF